MLLNRFLLRVMLGALLLSLLLKGNAFAQKQDVFLDFRHSEEQSWREYMARFPEGTIPGNFDVTFYHLDIEIEIESPFIQGSVLCLFEAAEESTDSITVNLHHALSIDSIAGNVDHYDFAADSIHIALDRTYQLGESAQVQIFYRGIPELAGGYKGLRYETHGYGEPIIASLSTPFLAHYWWPCKDGPGDKPDSVYIDITIPDTIVNGMPVMAISNGILENISTRKGKNTFQWRERYPIVPYYVMVAISNYRSFQQIFSGSWGESFPIDYYVFDEHLAEAQEGVAQLPDAIALFSQYFGPYPFEDEKYGMTQLGFYGGIENQTNTAIGKMSPEWFGISVHELAHMWFGDMITCQSWHHGWLNEGFATYCEALWAEHLDGFEGYKNNLYDNRYFQGGTLYLQDASDPFSIFINIIYSKGAWTLHMLRGVLGDSLFFDCLLEYASDPRFRYAHASTEDFQDVCETVSQMDLDFFFDQWVYDEYYPDYEYSFYLDGSPLEATVVLRQRQSDYGWRPVFKMPVQLKFQFVSGTDTSITVWNDQQQQTYHFAFPQLVNEMAFDPDEWILRTARQVVGVEETSPRLAMDQFSLAQNYPNPFNFRTTIRYYLPKDTEVLLKVYNIMGQEVVTLVDARQSAGQRIEQWDGKDDSGLTVGSGIYIYRLKAGDLVQSKKMIMLK